MKTMLQCVFVLALLMPTGCREKMPTAKAEALEKRICGCDSKDTSCAESVITEFVAFQREYNGFAEPKAAKEHLKAAMACAAKRDPKIADKVVEALKKRD